MDTWESWSSNLPEVLSWRRDWSVFWKPKSKKKKKLKTKSKSKITKKNHVQKILHNNIAEKDAAEDMKGEFIPSRMAFLAAFTSNCSTGKHTLSFLNAKGICYNHSKSGKMKNHQIPKTTG